MSEQFSSTLVSLFKEIYSPTLETYILPPEKTLEEWKKEYYDLLSKHQDYRLTVQLFQDAAKDVLLGGLDAESIAKLQEALAKAWSL